jgi:large subunit ribosomal protein L6
MSRIGKLEIKIPDGVEVNYKNDNFTVKGPKGTLTQDITGGIKVEINDGIIHVTRPNDLKQTRAFHGLYRSLINNMVIGVSQGFTINLEIVGTGYRAALKGNDINFTLGYSHEILFKIPEGIKAEVPENTKITISGHDKQQVGQIAARIRKLRSVEPYKGKGIRYKGEQFISKEGKSGKR